MNESEETVPRTIYVIRMQDTNGEQWQLWGEGKDRGFTFHKDKVFGMLEHFYTKSNAGRAAKIGDMVNGGLTQKEAEERAPTQEFFVDEYVFSQDNDAGHY